MSKLRLLPVLVTALVPVLVAAAPPARATFPGASGRIALVSDRFGGTDNVFSMKPDGSDVRQLTSVTADQGGDGEPAWSPDGRAIVFDEHSPDFSVWRLYLMNADGSNRHLVFSEDPALNDFQPSFSPDGS